MTIRRNSLRGAVAVLVAGLLTGLAAGDFHAAIAEGARSASGALGDRAPEPAAPPAAEEGRVVVLGFDGADWRTTERMMAAGELPNLARLAAGGTAGPLVSTDPAESAAGWAAINTGANPAKNGVASFVKRGVTGRTVGAEFAHIRETTVPIGETEPEGWLGALVEHGAGRVAAVAGIAVGLVFLLAFAFVLRARMLIAAFVAIALGGITAFAVVRLGRGLPREIPNVFENQVRLDGFWIHAARAGRPSVALDAALAFARPGASGARTLYGLGLPDVRGGTNGDWFIYTTDEHASGRPPRGDEKTSSSGTGTIFRVDWKDGAIDTQLFGPVDFVARDRLARRAEELERELADESLGFQDAKPLREERTAALETLDEMAGDATYKHRATVPLRIVQAGDAFDVTIAGSTQRVARGAWSDIFRLRFDLSPAVKAHAVTRVRVGAGEPFELYVDTLHIDPENQIFWQPASEPVSFGRELAELNGGPFETLGWGCLTNQQKDGMLPVEAFLEDVEFTMAYRRRLMGEMLKKDDWRLLFSVFSTLDRVQHILYRHYDEGHPAHDPEEAARTVRFFGEDVALADAIPAMYRQMDEIVGEALAALRADDTLLLCADHGFTSYRRGLVVNNWLAKEGFLTLAPDADRAGKAWLGEAVDWSRTQAYSLGLGMVYLNLAGREPAGIVDPKEADAILARIRERFLALEDEGVSVGSSARSMRETYAGPDAWGTLAYPCADLMLGFDEHYRVAWTSVDGSLRLVKNAAGGIEVGPLFEDNDNAWSGDHASNDPELVTGIFFCNRPVRSSDGAPFSVLDVAPTVLARLGVPLPPELDRPPLAFE